MRAAQRGARVTTLTISAEQARLAEERLAAAGVADRVQVLLRDYREARGSYDAVVSVEMIEAVGERYWPTYFTALDRLLEPGGRVGLQAITMPHDRMLATRGDYTWIHKYIFPGGLIPSVAGDRAAPGRAHDAAAGRAAQPRASTTPARCAHWREHFLSPLGGRGRARLRQHVPPDVGLLPRVLRGRLPRRLPRRRPVLPGAPVSTPVAAQLAGLVERLLGAPLPVRIRAWDGARRAPTAGPVVVLRHRRALRRLLWSPGELGLARAYVAGDLDVDGDLADGLSRSGRWRSAPAAPPAVRHGRRCSPPPALAAAARRGRATAAAAGVGGPPRRPAAQPPPRPRRDRPPLRPLQRLLRLPARPADGLLVRLLDAGAVAVLRPRRRPARQARPHLPQARAPARHAAAGRRLRLGVAPRARGPALRRAGHRGHALGAAARPTGGPGRGARPRRPGRDPAAGLPRARRTSRTTRSASIEMGEHVGEHNYPEYAAQLHRLLRPAGQAPAAADVAGRGRGEQRAGRRPVHRALHRARHAHAPARRDARACWRRPGSRSWTSTRCGSTTSDGAALARHPRGAPGGGRGADRRGAVAGVAALPRGRAAGVRGEPDGRGPDPHGAARRPGSVGPAAGAYVGRGA